MDKNQLLRSSTQADQMRLLPVLMLFSNSTNTQTGLSNRQSDKIETSVNVRTWICCGWEQEKELAAWNALFCQGKTINNTETIRDVPYSGYLCFLPLAVTEQRSLFKTSWEVLLWKSQLTNLRLV